MLHWAKSAVGITDKEHGPDAIHSVAKQGVVATEVKRDDLAWECMDGTNVETKTFYMTSDNGRVGLCQIIYSNVMGVRTTAQFDSKIFAQKPGEPHLWSSENLKDFEFSQDKQDFHAKGCSMELSADGASYHVKSDIDKRSIVDLTFTQTAPSFAAGKDGTTYFGTDANHPWGRMKHLFWPRCRVTGTITTADGAVDFAGRGIFIHALQGMKPHFAAARWNFANFQSPTYSAVMMEFTTPPSYGSTVVNVGCIATDGGMLMVGATPHTRAEHTTVKGDPENQWPEPSAAAFTWEGQAPGGGPEVRATVEGSIAPRIDRVDVMGELPRFVKQIVAGASGTKPYIYQFTPSLPIKIRVGDEEKVEEGRLFMEATFIS